MTTFEGETADADWTVTPAWSPDGKQLALLVGGDAKLIYPEQHHGLQKPSQLRDPLPAALGQVRE